MAFGLRGSLNCLDDLLLSTSPHFSNISTSRPSIWIASITETSRLFFWASSITLSGEVSTLLFSTFFAWQDYEQPPCPHSYCWHQDWEQPPWPHF